MSAPTTELITNDDFLAIKTNPTPAPHMSSIADVLAAVMALFQEIGDHNINVWSQIGCDQSSNTINATTEQNSVLQAISNEEQGVTDTTKLAELNNKYTTTQQAWQSVTQQLQTLAQHSSDYANECGEDTRMETQVAQSILSIFQNEANALRS
jgi:hypothetical protein